MTVLNHIVEKSRLKKLGLSNKDIKIALCLAYSNTKLAREWHPTKNGNLTPSDVTAVVLKKYGGNALKDMSGNLLQLDEIMVEYARTVTTKGEANDST